MSGESAVRAWERMRDLVLDQYDRRKDVTEALGMSFVKAKALRRLAKGPMTMRELALQLLIDRPYATVLVDDLEERGLVSRTVNPDDRRSKLVTVTDEGRASADLATKILSTPPASLLALPPDDLRALDRILDQIVAG